MNILFDIGGTKTRIARGRGIDSFDTPIIFDTPQKYVDGIKKIKEIILDLSNGEPVQVIAGGIAGPFNTQTQTLLQSKNLPDWVAKPLAQDLIETFHSKVVLDNDSAMVGLGEAISGAGRGFSIVAYITVSTGVGGARIVDGKLDERSIGFEPGKQIMNEAGQTLEDLISGKSIFAETGKRPEDITDQKYWEEKAKILARGLSNVIVDWSPDVIVLGGSMMNTVGIPLPIVEQRVKELVTIFPTLPVLKKSELGDLGGLYGALAYLE